MAYFTGPEDATDVIPSIQYFQRDPRWTEAVYYSPSGLVRSLRVSNPTPVTIEIGDTVGLTIQAGDGCRFFRRSARYNHADCAALGRTFLNDPGERYHVATEGECRLLQLNLPIAMLDRIMIEDHDDARGLAALRIKPGAADLVLLRLLGRALLATASSHELAIREIVARMLTVHSARTKVRRAGGLPPATLRRVYDLVESAPESLTLGAMANEAGLSIYHFTREFHRETGMTPWNFVRLRRLWLAARLLANETISLHEVSRLTGFAHASHMAQSFRKTLGVSTAVVRGRLLP